MGGGFSVLVADDNVLVRDLMRAILGQTGEFHLVADAHDARSAAEAALEHQPDVALVDVRMPGGGPAAARGIRAASPRTRVIALSAHDDAVSVRLMLAAGAVSYLVKGTPEEELFATMRSVLTPPRPVYERVAAGPPQRILVALADPSALDELAEAVVAAPGLELVGLAQTAYHALSLATRLRPDVAVVDAAMTSGGAHIGAGIGATSPGTRIVGWAAAGSRAAIEAEAGLVVSAAEPADAILEAVARAAEGPVVLRDSPPAAGAMPSQRRFERLARVLSAGRLDVQLQPIIGLADEQPMGYEALARFPGHPKPGPDVWFAEAHRSEVGVELERLAVRCGLAELHRLPRDAFLAVNVSPDTAMSEGLRDDLKAADPARVVVELTEHAPVGDYDELTASLDALRDLGTRVAVDDCGAGFTSLRHVALINPDYLKLDMVLCRDVREPARAALARALVGFAQETGSLVIAEGIEQVDDLVALRELGVDMGQGFLLAKPARAELLLPA